MRITEGYVVIILTTRIKEGGNGTVPPSRTKIQQISFQSLSLSCSLLFLTTESSHNRDVPTLSNTDDTHYQTTKLRAKMDMLFLSRTLSRNSVSYGFLIFCLDREDDIHEFSIHLSSQGYQAARLAKRASSHCNMGTVPCRAT